MPNTFDPVVDIFNSFSTQIANFIPNFIGGLVILFLGWLLAKALSGLFNRVLIAFDMARVDKKLQSIEFFQALDIKSAVVISRGIYWFIMLGTITSAAEVMGLKNISEGITNFMAYLPKLISAALFFVVGSFIANIIKNVATSAFESMGIMAGRFIGIFIFYFIILLVSITALNQAGIDTTIITQNITVLVGAVLGAFAIGYGIASKDLIANMLASFYSKEKFMVGQRLRIGDVEGVIAKIDSTSLTLNSGDKKIILPLSKLTTSTVEIW